MNTTVQLKLVMKDAPIHFDEMRELTQPQILHRRITASSTRCERCTLKTKVVLYGYCCCYELHHYILIFDSQHPYLKPRRNKNTKNAIPPSSPQASK